MKQLTKTQLIEISNQILNEQISFNNPKFQPTADTTYQRRVAQGEAEKPMWQKGVEIFSENRTTLWLWALGIGGVLLPAGLRRYVSKRIKNVVPAGTRVTEGMRLRYLFQDIIAGGLVSKVLPGGIGQFVSIPSYLEALEKRVKAEADRTREVLTDPKAPREAKQTAREFLDFMETIPSALAGYKKKLMKQAINDYYTRASATIDEVLQTTGWGTNAELAAKARVRMPILKKIFNGSYVINKIPTMLIANQQRFITYFNSRPALNKTLNKISINSRPYSVIDKLQNNQVYQDAIYDKYLKLVNSTKLNYDAIDAYYNATNKFPGYKFWKEMQVRAGSNYTTFDEFRKQYFVYMVSRFS